jgi:hypothetical protein
MKTVSVIIPTLASANRRDQLLRAVRSVQQSSIFEQVCILVVVNGSQWDPSTLNWLESRESVSVHRLEVRSLPEAIRHGRALVATEFFCFLDDDDELLPLSLERRLQSLITRPEIDLAVSTGVIRIAGIESRAHQHFARVSQDPLIELFRENWLASCGGMYRTDSIGQKYFDHYQDFAEWTWLAYQLALDGRLMSFVDEPLFVINDTINSRSKNPECRRAYLDLYCKMTERQPPNPVQLLIEERISNVLHELSEEHLEQGELIKAIKMHVKSLVHAGGLKYTSYTRHLVTGAFRQLIRIGN